MKKITLRKGSLPALVLSLSLCFFIHYSASASPFGQGTFDADVPFGSLTSLSLSFSGDVALNLSPSGNNFTGQGSHTVTVTSTDVVGYKLYILAPNGTAMSNGTTSIPASSNATLAPLSVNTWGYNTNGTSSYKGLLATPSLIKDADGPYTAGDDSEIYYGVLTDITQPASNYNVDVVYTVVAEYQ
tara:strand:+ start:4148 stop:4705 length:558 start_codon:yes stop_codon:yes gene_type:complete